MQRSIISNQVAEISRMKFRSDPEGSRLAGPNRGDREKSDVTDRPSYIQTDRRVDQVTTRTVEEDYSMDLI
jgi:hypothetical protein